MKWALREIYTRFGKDEFENIVGRYVKSDGDPKVLTPDEREKFFSLIKDNHDHLNEMFGKINETMKEVSSIIAWSLSGQILREVLLCRVATMQFSILPLDESMQGKLDKVEQLLDSHIKSFTVFELMRHYAGVKHDAVYQ